MVVACSCGSTTAGTTDHVPTAGPSLAPGGTSSTSQTGSPPASPDIGADVPRLEVPSLGITLTLLVFPCDHFSAAGVPDPPQLSGYFVDCAQPGGGFYGVITQRGGAAFQLATAPAGIALTLYDVSGTAIPRTLAGDPLTLTQNPDGTWPGHGVPPGQPLLIELRASGAETERTASR